MKGVKKRLSHTEGELNHVKDSINNSSTQSLNAINSGAAGSGSNNSNQHAPHSATLTHSSSNSSLGMPSTNPTSSSTSPALSSSALSSSASSTVPSTDLSHLPRCRQSRSVTRDVLIHNLPALRDAPPASRKPLLLKKLRLCSFVFSFDESTLDSPQEAKEKELKRATLLELVNYLTVFKPSFTDDELAAIFDMLQSNLFRPLPPSTFELTGVYNPEEDEPTSEVSWVHLQVIYEFLLRLATSTETDSKLMDKYFTRKFILSLLELFDSEDPRERDYLKTILHRIYGNFMSLRPFIRRAINNVFYRFIYETDRHNGIAELLEILGSIINGFALPLKEQHKQFLIRVLLPLHKVTHVAIFHPQLSYWSVTHLMPAADMVCGNHFWSVPLTRCLCCVLPLLSVTQFLEKDQTLAPAIITAILKFWPITASKKELMFLNEVEEILDRIQSAHLTGESEMELFKRIAACINSPHFQVSERAIYILNNDIIVRFVSAKREVLIPVLARALIGNTYMADERENEQVTAVVDQLMSRMRASKPASGPQQPQPPQPQDDAASLTDDLVSPYPLSPLLLSPHSLHLGHASQGRPGHWNATIVELTSDIIKLLAEMDGALVDKLLEEREREVQDRVRRGEERVRRWEELRRQKQQWEYDRQRGKLPIDSPSGQSVDGGSGGSSSSSNNVAVGVPIAVGGGSGSGAMEQ